MTPVVAASRPRAHSGWAVGTAQVVGGRNPGPHPWTPRLHRTGLPAPDPASPRLCPGDGRGEPGDGGGETPPGRETHQGILPDLSSGSGGPGCTTEQTPSPVPGDRGPTTRSSTKGRVGEEKSFRATDAPRALSCQGRWTSGERVRRGE